MQNSLILEKPSNFIDCRGSMYGQIHEGSCDGNTCNKCYENGNFKHKCTSCNWVFNRFQCPNKMCQHNIPFYQQFHHQFNIQIPLR